MYTYPTIIIFSSCCNGLGWFIILTLFSNCKVSAGDGNIIQGMGELSESRSDWV